MPGRNGTGPAGQGQAGGRPFGGAGRGAGRGAGLGADGACVCPSCGTRVPHARATPCYTMKCPKCGALMTRG